MSASFAGVGVILSLELRQRVRTVSWYILLAVFVGLILMVIVLLSIAFLGFGQDGGGIYSTIICFVLLLGALAAPARETIETTTPGWAVGLFVQLVLTGGLLVGAHAGTATSAPQRPQRSSVAAAVSLRRATPSC